MMCMAKTNTAPSVQHHFIIVVQVAEQAEGRSFKRKKTIRFIRQRKNLPIESCTGRSTSAIPKPRCLCAPAFGRSVWCWRFGGGFVSVMCVGVGDVMCCDVVFDAVR